MFGQDRDSLRRFLIAAWNKAQAGETLQPLERLIADVVAIHPEYHALLGNDQRAVSSDFPPEDGQTNPFLHLGMHITIAEQLSTDRPAGIRELYQRMAQAAGDGHAAEHQIMECLAQMIWEAQRNHSMPNNELYLECIARLS